MIDLGPSTGKGGEAMVFDRSPVEDMSKYDFQGTTFYRSSEGKMKCLVRRWFLVNVAELEDGDYQSSVEVYDQQFLNPYGHSASGPVTDTKIRKLEQRLEEPGSDIPPFVWIEQDLSLWLTEWDEQNPPAELLL